MKRLCGQKSKKYNVDFTLNENGSEKEDAIFYKVNLSDKEYKTLKCDSGRPIQTRRRNVTSTVISNKELAQAYTKPIPLPSPKVKDLQSLCQTGTIPDRFHHFYNSLKSSQGATACDSEEEN
ncbi:hypothetical protein O0L34_g13504 [Tuta absoluta]|nr:hypothetical protein O0L34_g13504 [Tuta absoluta]